MNKLLMLSVIVLALAPVEGRADIRPTWHCHPHSNDFVRCHRQFRGKLVAVGTPDVRCVVPPQGVRIGDDGKAYTLARTPGCKIVRRVIGN